MSSHQKRSVPEGGQRINLFIRNAQPRVRSAHHIKAEMAELLQYLRALGARGQPGVFACSGEVETPRPIALSYKTTANNKDSTSDSPTRRYKIITLPSSNNQNIQDLLSVCRPATHGHGNKTVLDTSYRLASTLEASEFALSFDLSELSILPTIQQFLAPQSELSEKVGVRASLYKLNVYGPGGFFKSHVDTPRGEDTFGTLVVCLPCEFTGGVLTVHHNNEDEKMDWSASGFAITNLLRWGAFFSDCEHWIDEVTSGYRITVTYNLQYVTCPQMSPCVDPVHGNLLLEKMQDALQSPSFAPKGAVLGVSLAHYYAIDGSEEIAMLKGVDQVWKEALDYLGLQYKFVLAFKRNEESFERGSSRTQEDDEETAWDDRESLDDWDGDGDFSLFLRDRLYMTNSARVDLENVSGGERECLRTEMDAVTCPEVVWIVRPRDLYYEDHAVRYGNEPLLSTYYAAVCLLVTIPSAGERAVKKRKTED